MSSDKNIQAKSLESLRSEFIYTAFDESILTDFLVDLSKNKIINFKSKPDFIKQKTVFSEFIESFAKERVHSDDSQSFLDFFILDTIKAAYDETKSGKVKRILEFRINKYQDVSWCRAVINCFKTESGFFCYIYIKDINSYKSWQSELIFKSEHDSLTEMRNKLSTEAYVNTYLESFGTEGLHALFFFDIDDFKLINSSFGHIFGDVFLARTARKTRELFRKEDVLGRIGGDEFVIFMKNIPTKQVALLKAEEMIKAIEDRFVMQGKIFKTTISVGISFTNGNSKNYLQLLKEADKAMYYCKSHGKNKFAVYTEEMESTTVYRPTNEDNYNAHEYDPGEYVFRTLRDTDDKDKAFKLALEIIGRYFEIDHVAIYETSAKKFTYSYSKNGENEKAKRLASLEVTDSYISSFIDGLFHYSQGSMSINPELSDHFLAADCISAIHYSITYAGKFFGLICFSRYAGNRAFTHQDTIVLRNIANILSMFLVFFNKK